ncbi:hypothetical protein KCV06_g152, partial [Aureobasidium melanogenum]
MPRTRKACLETSRYRTNKSLMSRLLVVVKRKLGLRRERWHARRSARACKTHGCVAEILAEVGARGSTHVLGSNREMALLLQHLLAELSTLGLLGLTSLPYQDESSEEDAVGGAAHTLGDRGKTLLQTTEVNEGGHESGNLDRGSVDERLDELLDRRKRRLLGKVEALLLNTMSLETGR